METFPLKSAPDISNDSGPASPTLADLDLARRASGGDHAAAEIIMRRHNRAMFRTARAILGDEAEAEDAVQEAYLQAFRCLAQFQGHSRLSTWLARIVANEAIGRLRKRERRAHILPLHAGAIEDEAEEVADMDTAASPETAAQDNELRHILEAEIDALPDLYRTVFVLRAVEELSAEETAEILQIPSATVRSRFLRARSQLRERLALKIDVTCANAFNFAGERCDRIVAAVLNRLNQGAAK